MESEKEILQESKEEKKVNFDTKQEEEEVKEENNSEKGGKSSTGYGIKIAVSQKQYSANKKNSSLYSGLTFIPLNLFHQLQNPVFQFYLVIMILEVIPQVSITKGLPNTLLPYSIVILIQMIVDCFIYFKVNNLDWIQNSMKVRFYIPYLTSFRSKSSKRANSVSGNPRICTPEM